jgi:Holliday junction DNA helicase RuvB
MPLRNSNTERFDDARFAAALHREEIKRRLSDHRSTKRANQKAATDEDERSKPEPIGADNESKNRLRPRSFDDVVGQDQAKSMMRRVIEATSTRNDVALDHTLLIGPAGTGKTTFATVIAIERGTSCYQVAAPVPIDTLLDLAEVMQPGDILFIDEIHMQAVQERRGKEAVSSPEVFLTLLEDSILMTQGGMMPFPDITIIGATTDPGRLPDPFLDRFPLQPRLTDYSQRELEVIAERNATILGLTCSPDVIRDFAGAARGVPRIVNNYMRNAASLAPNDRFVMPVIGDMVLGDLNQTTKDGLTLEMQGMLKFLYKRCRRERGKDHEVTYQASVNTIATAIGLSRDTKAVQLRVEPYLLKVGYVQVGHGGRFLTPMGVAKALELLKP